MRILFHTNTLNYRGTTVAVTDYARYNQEILGNTSIIGYNADWPYYVDGGNEPQVVEQLSKYYQVVNCQDNQDTYEKIVDQFKIDNFYSIRYGVLAPYPTNCKTSIHAVFQAYEPHGSAYAYVSEWLANTISNNFSTTCAFVPHIIDLPPPTQNLRHLWNIPQHAKVFGRHGGLNTFDITWVKETINKLLSYRLDYYFVFANTDRWIDHPRVIFLDTIYDLQTKSNYINSCDAMIHARSQGESFGLSIAEFLSQNKPVLAWRGGGDQNHTIMLQDSGLLYNDPEDLEILLNNFYLFYQNWRQRVQSYAPSEVMTKFQQVFLS